MRLTKRDCEAARYGRNDNRRVVLWDEAIPGFGLRVYPSGKKAFVVIYRAARRNHFMTLGAYGRFTRICLSFRYRS